MFCTALPLSPSLALCAENDMAAAAHATSKGVAKVLKAKRFASSWPVNTGSLGSEGRSTSISVMMNDPTAAVGFEATDATLLLFLGLLAWNFDACQLGLFFPGITSP